MPIGSKGDERVKEIYCYTIQILYKNLNESTTVCALACSQISLSQSPTIKYIEKYSLRNCNLSLKLAEKRNE